MLPLLVVGTAVSCRLEVSPPSGDMPPWVMPSSPEAGLSDVSEAASGDDVNRGSSASGDASDAAPPSATPPEPAPSAPPCLVVLTGDFSQTASLSLVDTATGSTWPNVTTVHADSVLQPHGARLFVLERLGADTLLEVDPARGLAVVGQRTLGARSNPWSMGAGTADHAWVALYGEDRLARVRLDPQRSARVGVEIDLARWSAPGGHALPALLVDDADRVHVLLQRLRRFGCVSETPGKVLTYAREALTTLKSEGALPAPEPEVTALRWCNPVTALATPSGLLVGSAGAYRVRGGTMNDGGIELLSDSGSRFLVDEEGLGGRDVVLLRPGADVDTVWVLAADANFSTSVLRLELPDGRLHPSPLWTSEGVQDLVAVGDEIWISDRSPRSPGLIRVNARTGERTDGGTPLAVGGAPQTLVALPREMCGLPP